MLEEVGAVAQWRDALREEHALEVGARQVRPVPIRAPYVPRDLTDRHVLHDSEPKHNVNTQRHTQWRDPQVQMKCLYGFQGCPEWYT